MKRRKPIIALNIVIILFEIVGFIYSWFEYGWGMFRFFTQDSNLFALINSIILLVFLCTTNVLPKWFVKMRYVAVLLLATTFMVTLCILAPMQNAFVRMFTDGSKLYQHTICPILFFISFFALERTVPKEKKCIFCGIVPTLIYAVILVILNILGVVDGPYPFLRVQAQPVYMSFIWAVVIFGGALLMAWGVWALGTLSQKTAHKTA